MSLLRYAQMTPILCVKITSKLVFFTVSTYSSLSWNLLATLKHSKRWYQCFKTSNWKVTQMKPDGPLFLQSNQVLAIQAKQLYNKIFLNAWNINRFFILLPIETDFSQMAALWAYWDLSRGPPIGFESILYGKITSKLVF